MPTGPAKKQVALSPGIVGDDRDLVGALHRFGEFGPVYEVVGLAENGFVTICLVESGEMATYPADEVRNDPNA